MAQKYWIRAAGVGLTVFFTALLGYDRPPELGMYWQPVVQAFLAALAQLGFNAATRTH